VTAEPRKAVFLDRDGVLVRAPVHAGLPTSIDTVDQLELETGAETACRSFHDAGFVLVVVTNQPEIARGRLGRDAVERMHVRLRELLPLDEIVVCPHEDADGCDCRKPKPGMLVDAAARHGIDLGRSFMVGDRWRDVEAGNRAGCTTVFVDRQYSEAVTESADVTVGDLDAARHWILARGGA
jgi:D-glycero-D-manno-heptose 1,7-bisphosphate phosphatase